MDRVSQQQPRPAPGRQDVSPVARARFLATFDAQDAVGLEKYGTRLQTGNGRNFAVDAWQELADFTKYLAGLEMELDELAEEVIQLRTANYASHAHIARLEGKFQPGHPDHGRCGGCRV